MDEQDARKTAFLCEEGLYQWIRMPYGLKCSGATFNRALQLALTGLLPDICSAYIDDICIYGKDIPEELANVRQVFQKLREAGMKLFPGKCQLFQKEVNYLGFIVSAEGIKPDPAKIAAVQKWNRPCMNLQRRIQNSYGTMRVKWLFRL